MMEWIDDLPLGVLDSLVLIAFVLGILAAAFLLWITWD